MQIYNQPECYWAEPMIDRNQIIHSKLTLLFLVLASFAIRAISSLTVFADGKVTFTGMDPFYHMRRIIYTTLNFPSTLTFDSYLNYPYGFDIGWPPLYDQAAALFAMVLGFGNPDIHTIEVAGAIFPALLGALTIIPIYIIASSLFDKRTALLSAAVISLIPAHLAVSRVGATDHHVAEILLSTTAYALFMLSLKYGKDANLSFSSIKKIGSQRSIAKPLVFAGAAGIVLALSVFTWLGSPIFIGLIVLYALVQFMLDLRQKVSSEYLVINTLTTYLVTLIVITPFISTLIRPGYEFSGMFLSWFHVLYVAVLLASIIVLGAISWIIGSKGLKWWYYPVVVIMVAGTGTAALSFISPELYQSLTSGLLYLLGWGEVLGMITEAQPLIYDDGFTLTPLWHTFVIFSITAVIGFSLILRNAIKDKYPPEMVFFIIWSFIVTILALSQTRFTYLLSINIAILTGYFIIAVFDLFKDDSDKDKKKKKKRSKNTSSNISFWQIGYGTCISIIFILVVGLLFFGPTISILTNPGVPPSDWEESLDWLESNSPKTSYYLDPVEKPEYGVLSWWDYGNWILYMAERPPVANNFQTGLKDSARFFASSNESECVSILKKRNVRYVITDTSMVAEKFTHIMNIATGNSFTNNEFERFYMSEQFMDTNLAKLHISDTAQISNLRLIYESNSTSQSMHLGSRIDNYENISNIKIFEYVPGATVEGFARPDREVHAKTNVTLSNGRIFEYWNTATTNESGWYELTLPYSTTGTPYNAKVENYSITADANTSMIKEVEVTEEDVISGNRLRNDLL
ncbi:MAG: dolichyl-diphosphooligosaccharide--protein glycosyltransferase [Methanohalophilus sp. T328-1]|nr:MAG: dolichyl-diphosphooligosaccharide--protein glycosyltransferase [Methanohalophilus sp. T328-1]ODV49992.1 MAG: dolichyl-diphosphooligosaccharide--protein glycosyltransferase [Methanohalophilus sp. 2-GBenrich]RSD35079.1 MAG: dolichyl-diphosphooligosaccharide--protein glycosyltransferase [Methanohalophilus sp.]RXG34824.1 dolichyl-diphosphooligosaccharide--protein glycosyltransferase [Methanohalophilus sp. WG1-DM]